MSWLVAVCFPGLLMIFTVGLQRLERLVHTDRMSPAELIASLERAARTARQRAAARTAGKSTSRTAANRLDPLLLVDEPGLPTRPNPVFQPSG
jgi:hypothetical protein